MFAGHCRSLQNTRAYRYTTLLSVSRAQAGNDDMADICSNIHNGSVHESVQTTIYTAAARYIQTLWVGRVRGSDPRYPSLPSIQSTVAGCGHVEGGFGVVCAAALRAGTQQVRCHATSQLSGGVW
jgi:hypothetical protein